MSKTSQQKKKTASAADGTHQTLLLTSRTMPRDNQKVKFYLSDGFITLLLAVVALLFIIILAAAIALHLGNYSHVKQSVRRPFDQGENNTNDSLEFTTSDENLTVTTEPVTASLEVPAAGKYRSGLPRGTHVEEGFVLADED